MANNQQQKFSEKKGSNYFVIIIIEHHLFSVVTQIYLLHILKASNNIFFSLSLSFFHEFCPEHDDVDEGQNVFAPRISTSLGAGFAFHISIVVA